jgi:hypothetical protein
MTNQHPITPPEELVQQWGKDVLIEYSDTHWGYEQILCAWAARWSADQELEACCEVLSQELVRDGKNAATDLRIIRRPKLPTLKEQALDALRKAESTGCLYVNGRSDLIRRALEGLPND